jgi:hypothetical protein
VRIINALGRAVAVMLALTGCGGFPDPAELPGSYRSTNAPATLELASDRWELTNGHLVKSGPYATSGNRIAFQITAVSLPAFVRYCRDRADVYGWRLEDGRLVLRAVGEVCDPVAQAVLVAGPWERREGEG